jgi:threonine/homoserine/homoserine lactone efflux protein
MLYLAWRIAADCGDLSFVELQSPCPSFVTGLVTQALNPKAWIVSLSAITIYVAPHLDYMTRLVTFSVIFFLICAISLAIWVVIGAQVARFSGNVALFNRLMAGLLALSVIAIVIEALQGR